MKRQQIQTQEQLTAYNRKTTHDIFFMTMEWLEKYIEVSGYYPDWENRKQIQNNNVKRLDIIGNPEKAERDFLTQLFLFWGTLKRNLPFSDELKAEFYQWINAVKIDNNNCPKRLKHLLYGFNEVLEGRGEKLQDDIENMEEELDSTEYMEQMGKVFAYIQAPIRDEEEVKKTLRGKTNKDIKIEKKFSGDGESGEKIFSRLTEKVSNNDFRFFPKKLTSSNDVNLDKVIEDFKTNPQNWILDKITAEIDDFGEIKKQEVAVYRQDARLNDFNTRTGKLNFNDNPIYKWNSFKVQQKFKIRNTLSENKTYLDKTYLTDDEISFVIKEFADNPNVWRIDKIRGHDYLIHSSAQISESEIGTLIHNKEKFSSQEWTEINEVLELNKQYGIVLKKLKGEISFEYQETRETLEIWAKELEKRLLINCIRMNKDEWEIRKEIVVLDFNKGEVLARKTAKINREEDYDLTGGLINRSNKFYSLDCFDDNEKAEINLIFQPVRQEIVDDIKREGEFTLYNIIGTNEKWFIRNSVDLSSGRVVFDPKNMYKVNDLNEAEQKEVGYKSEASVKNSVFSTIPKNNDDNSISTGKVLGIIGVISAVVIASVVVVRKRLNKKIKK